MERGAWSVERRKIKNFPGTPTWASGKAEWMYLHVIHFKGNFGIYTVGHDLVILYVGIHFLYVDGLDVFHGFGGLLQRVTGSVIKTLVGASDYFNDLYNGHVVWF